MSPRQRQSGLTLVEILVAVVLLAILLVPAILALQTGIVGTDVHADVTSNHLRLSSRLEELLAEPFTALQDAASVAGGPTNPSSYSEPATVPGRLVVYLAGYDGDNADADNDPFTGADAGLLWLRVEIEDSAHALETLRAQGF